MIQMSEQVHETETGRTRVRWVDGGGFTIVSRLKSGEEVSIPIDPKAIDRLVEVWPAFKAKAIPGATAPSAPPETPSPTASRAGPAAPSSRSSPPPSSGRLL